MHEAQRVCIYGGSFNPPHICHVLATTWALSALDVDCVLWVPTFSHAFGKDLAPYDDRIQLAEDAVEIFGARVAVSRIEEELGGESRTIDTVLALRERQPSATWTLLIGADILEETHRWKAWDELQTLVDVRVVGRVGAVGNPASASITLPDVSSTAVRAALAAGRLDQAASMLPSQVARRIHELGLYGVSPSGGLS